MKYAKLAYRYFEHNDAVAGAALSAAYNCLIDSCTESVAIKASEAWNKWMSTCTNVRAHNKWIDDNFNFLK